MAKGGFAGSLALLAIPMMAFFIPPFQAVAILLIPLIFMDIVTVYRYRGMWDWSIVRYIIPLGIFGVVLSIDIRVDEIAKIKKKNDKN